MFRPHLEVFHSGKVLVLHTEIKIQFHFKDPNFWTYERIRDNAVNKSIRLLPGDIEIRFILCQFPLNSNLYNTLTIERQKEHYAEFPVVRGEIRTYTFQGDTDSWEENNIFQDRVPDRMIVGLSDAKGFNGDRDLLSLCLSKVRFGNHRANCEGRIPLRNTPIEQR